MKKIKFLLKKAVRITPVSGTSNVSITTTGDVLVTESSTCNCHREPHTTLAETARASLKRSPKGHNIKLTVILPAIGASELAFHKEVSKLFQILRWPFGYAY